MAPGLQHVGVRFSNFFPGKLSREFKLTSPNVDISPNSNGYFSVMRNATVTWLVAQVVLHVLCMLT